MGIVLLWILFTLLSFDMYLVSVNLLEPYKRQVTSRIKDSDGEPGRGGDAVPS